MAVRPFWIEANWTGKAAPVKGGPLPKDGELDLTVKIREEGSISTKVLRVAGYQMRDKLVLQAWVNDGPEGCHPLPEYGRIELEVRRD